MERILHWIVIIGFVLIGYNGFGQTQHVVISEVYGGGGNSGSVYKNDFIELYNPTSTSVSLTGWSVQYTSSSGTTWQVTNLSGSIAANGYFLVQEAAGTAGTTNLPSPDVIGTLAISATTGKIALCNTTSALSGANPSGGALVDLVGFGTANGFEGAVGPAPSNTTSIERKANASSTAGSMRSPGADTYLGNGQDTDNNANDFVTSTSYTPQPQNSSTRLEPDTTAPIFTTGYPSSANITESQFDLAVSLNEDGTFYYVILPDGATAPTAAQVKAGQDNAGNSIALSGNQVVSSGGSTVTKTISGLNYSTNYDVFVIADDTPGNLQSSPTKLDVATTNTTLPTISPSVSVVTFNTFTDKSKLSAPVTYSLNTLNLTDKVSISVTGNFLISLDNSTYSASLSVDNTLFSSPQTVYVKFNPSGNVGSQSGTITHSSTGATNKLVSLSAIAIDPFNQNFNDPNFLTNSGWIQYSRVGAQVWGSTNFGHTCLTGCTDATVDKAAQINGYSGSSQNNEDWLISPLLDVTSFVNYPALSFWTISAFSGDGLQLKYSSDYTGTGDPTLATWTALDGKFPASNSSLWTQSVNIILPKQAIYVAVIYTSNTTAASRWTFDDWQVTDASSYIDVPAINYSFGEVVAGNSSASKNFTFIAKGYGDITVTAPSGYQVSLDNASFASSQVVTSTDASAGKTIYVIFSPSVKQLKWDGTINFKGTGLDTNYGKLTGSSYPKSETFDVVCYNLEFFGSDVKDTSGTEFGPTDDALQVSNVSTVMQTLGVDIYGVEEIADDNAFATLVSNLPGYSGILSDKWSYSFNPPDPNFPPQKVGFIYNNTTVKLVSTRVMFSQMYDAIRAGNTSLLPGYPTTASSFWSSGRLPYMATFDVTINGNKKRIRMIDIHAKSGSDQDSYNRRKYDVQVLHDSLTANYPNDNIILVGDYNDDVDTSINTGSASTYKSFVDDATNFNTLTYTISQAGAYSFPSSSSFLDHIITSNELNKIYINNSITVEDPRSYISNYSNTTSDHLPVSARFDFTVKSEQSISFNSVDTKKAGDAAFTLSASSTSGLTISYTSSEPTIASVSGSTVTILKAGTVKITASQAGDSNYNAATSVDQTLAINKANQTITFNSLPAKTLGDAAFSVSATSSSGLAVTFAAGNSKVTVSGSQVTLVAAGNATVTATQAGNGNYNAATAISQSFCIKPTTPIITLTNANTDTPTLTSSASTGNQWYLGGNAIANATNTTLTATAAGSYKVQVTVEGCSSGFSAEQVLVVTGDLTVSKPNVQLYPNPVIDWLIISLPDLIGKKNIFLYDLAGRQMAAQEVNEDIVKFNVANLIQGTYIIKIQSENKVSISRFEKL